MPNRRQAIIWTDDGQVWWRIRVTRPQWNTQGKVSMVSGVSEVVCFVFLPRGILFSRHARTSTLWSSHCTQPLYITTFGTRTKSINAVDFTVHALMQYQNFLGQKKLHDKFYFFQITTQRSANSYGVFGRVTHTSCPFYIFMMTQSANWNQST